MVSVGVDSKDNVWGLERNPKGSPQLFKFGPDHKLLFKLGDDVITHHVKAHGMLDVKPTADAFETRANVIKAIQGHILAKAVYGGLFKRPQ